MADKKTSLRTPTFRVSFPNLFVARAIEPGAVPKYGTSAIWTPANFTETEKDLWRKILAELNAKSLETFKSPWRDLPANVKRGLRDGREKEGMEGYGAGTYFASLTTHMQPGVVDRDPNIPIGPSHGNADRIYPGCYARATVNVYAYANKGKGVALGLMNLQFVKDGPRLDSRTDAAEDFEEVPEDMDIGGMDDMGL